MRMRRFRMGNALQRSVGISSPQESWLNLDSFLLCFSAFFADLGYQAVSAVFPLFIVIEMRQPAYIYGVLFSFGYGIGT